MVIGRDPERPTLARRGLCGVTIVLALLVSACATPSASYQIPATLSEALAATSEEDRRACEEFARKEADSVQQKSVGGAFLRTTGDMGAGLLGWQWLGLPFMPLVPIVGVLAANATVEDNERVRQRTYGEAMELCLKPRILEQTRGPGDPEVWQSLVALAERYRLWRDYAAAEQSYRRALAAQEKILGPDHPDVATTLEAYAAVLARLDRQDEAEELVARYQAIREKHRQSQPQSGGGRSGEQEKTEGGSK